GSAEDQRLLQALQRGVDQLHQTGRRGKSTLNSALHGKQFPVAAFAVNEFLMPSALHDSPVFNDQNLIGFLDRTQTVSNDKGGAVLHQFLQTLLDKGLALCVEIRSGFVEDNDFWIRE